MQTCHRILVLLLGLFEHAGLHGSSIGNANPACGILDTRVNSSLAVMGVIEALSRNSIEPSPYAIAMVVLELILSIAKITFLTVMSLILLSSRFCYNFSD
jgi:hypothetical protein